jgi:type II secretory pathway pseudopilin PulG
MVRKHTMLRRLRNSTIFNNSGDTIVEVMIVLAIIALALSISYETANASLLSTRQAEESAEATHLVSSQIDSLRALSLSGSDLVDNGTPFCIYNSGGVLSVQAEVSSTVPPDCISSFYTTLIYSCDNVLASLDTTYQSVCDSSNVGAAMSPTPPYDTFVVVTSWPDVAGAGTDTVTQAYRMHKLLT